MREAAIPHAAASRHAAPISDAERPGLLARIVAKTREYIARRMRFRIREAAGV